MPFVVLLIAASTFHSSYLTEHFPKFIYDDKYVNACTFVAIFTHGIYSYATNLSVGGRRAAARVSFISPFFWENIRSPTLIPAASASAIVAWDRGAAAHLRDEDIILSPCRRPSDRPSAHTWFYYNAGRSSGLLRSNYEHDGMRVHIYYYRVCDSAVRPSDRYKLISRGTDSAAVDTSARIRYLDIISFLPALSFPFSRRSAVSVTRGDKFIILPYRVSRGDSLDNIAYLAV